VGLRRYSNHTLDRNGKRNRGRISSRNHGGDLGRFRGGILRLLFLSFGFRFGFGRLVGLRENYRYGL
jgi:hypothetical protein